MNGEPPGIAETHSAWVVFMGDRAYKRKKPVTLPFLDFSTRRARERAAHREVELNRRLAPDVYLGVADVTGPDGELCDHLVVMRRMPTDRRLSTLVELGASLDVEIRAVARAIAAFHAAAETSPEIAAAGSPDAISDKLERDLAELAAFTDTTPDEEIVDDVTTLVRRYLAGRTALLEGRIARGCVRDGHGDLLADDIFCLPDGPRILDCIEFDDRLRYGDVLADVAFLSMDLERLGADDLAAQLLSWYQEFSNEHHPATLADFYVAHRALIRSKVAYVRTTQGDGDAERAAHARLAQAHHHLQRARIRLVLVGGAPGTGKSTIAAALGEHLGWPVLRSDDVRKDVAGVGRAARSAAPFGQGIYDVPTTRVTYDALLGRAKDMLRHGESVILDASWANAEWRAAATVVAEETASDLVELRCDAPPGVAAERVAERFAGGRDVSDADSQIALAVPAVFDRWPSAATISTLMSPAHAFVEALGAVETRRGSASAGGDPRRGAD